MGAALAAGHVLRERGLTGKVVLFGTPAEGMSGLIRFWWFFLCYTPVFSLHCSYHENFDGETNFLWPEGGGGKIKLLNAGAFKDHGVDVSLISHPGITADSALVRTAAYSGFNVEYFGKEAHAAAAPWEGVSDRSTNAMVCSGATDGLHSDQRTRCTHHSLQRHLSAETADATGRYHPRLVLTARASQSRFLTNPGQITNGGLRPNIIHAYASGRFVVRSSSKERLAALSTRVKACFQAGATATGATLKLTPKMSYDDHVPNCMLGASYRSQFARLGGHIPAPGLDGVAGATQASTDQGNVSHALPSLSPGVWIRSEDPEGKQLGGPHTPDFERAARTEENHGLALRAAKALGGTGVDVLTRPELLREVKREFEGVSKNRAT